MAETSRKIPEETKRTVRQRCGFGCVVCGLPLYEYHHMIEWAKTKTHNSDDLTLLCGSHHREVTNGLMTPDQISEANAKPINTLRGISSPFGLHIGLSEYHAIVGGNRFSSNRREQFPVICVDDIDLIWFRIDDRGQVFLHMNIFDEVNNRALVVVGNELMYATSLWDITFEGKTLILREEKRALLLQITFLPPRAIRIDRGCLL